MSVRVRFTIRELGVLIAVVAHLLGVFRWVATLLLIDPRSELVAIADVPQQVSWTAIQWEPDLSGVRHDFQVFTPAVASLRSQGDKEVHQTLIDLSYDDGFAREIFHARCWLSGWWRPDWSDYCFHTYGEGGGSTDGGCHVQFAFDAASKQLTVVVHQNLNSRRQAKQAQFLFVHDGTRFSLMPSASLPH